MDIKEKYVSNLAPYIYAWSVWKKVEFKYQKFYIIFLLFMAGLSEDIFYQLGGKSRHYM